MTPSLLSEGLERQIRQADLVKLGSVHTAESDVAPLNIGWSVNCLSSSTKSTGVVVEVARGFGNVHWTSQMMVMMMVMVVDVYVRVARRRSFVGYTPASSSSSASSPLSPSCRSVT